MAVLRHGRTSAHVQLGRQIRGIRFFLMLSQEAVLALIIVVVFPGSMTIGNGCLRACLMQRVGGVLLSTAHDFVPHPAASGPHQA